MKKLTILVLIFISSYIFATAQYPDLLIYKGKKYKLHTNPLEKYFKEYPKQRPKDGLKTTASYRGYIAEFEINNKNLELRDLKIETSFQKWKSIKKEFLINYKKTKKLNKKKSSNNKELKLDWFSGILIIPYGKRLNYVHMGYASTYENYILLEIQKGKLTKQKDLKVKEYELFKKVQFSKFKKTEEYKKVFSRISKKGKKQKLIDNFLKIRILKYTNKFLD